MQRLEGIALVAFFVRNTQEAALKIAASSRKRLGAMRNRQQCVSVVRTTTRNPAPFDLFNARYLRVLFVMKFRQTFALRLALVLQLFLSYDN